ncbi:tetratricopeptide repeat protein, partial [Candidatus Falkowbacteria bacterium]|nr:tetratricopeptide repeat protein [Candidatus Falkowbacteria bacterium]
IFVYLSLLILVVAFYYGTRLVWADFLVAKTSQMTYMKIEDFSIAENNMRYAVDINPYRLDYKFYLANIFINKELFYKGLNREYNKAEIQSNIESILAEVLSSPTNKPDNLIWLKGTYNYLKLLGYQTYNSEASINQKLLFLDPYNPELYVDRALLNSFIYSALENSQEDQIPDQEMEMQIILEKIKSDLEKSIELKNNYGLGYYNLGLYYEKLRDYVKAQEYFKKAFDYDPQESIIAETLKNIYLKDKEYDKAIDIINRYLEFNYNDINFREELASLYYETSKFDEVKRQADIILQIDPENTQAKVLLEKI